MQKVRIQPNLTDSLDNKYSFKIYFSKKKLTLKNSVVIYILVQLSSYD